MAVRHLGVTGTRDGMTPEQMRSFIQFLGKNPPGQFNHGGAPGVDTEAHWLVAHLFPGCPIHVWPFEGREWKMDLYGVFVQENSGPPLVRNGWIVDASTLMVAVVAGAEKDYPRSGTWACVRYARRNKKTTWVIWPSGEIRKDVG